MHLYYPSGFMDAKLNLEDGYSIGDGAERQLPVPPENIIQWDYEIQNR